MLFKRRERDDIRPLTGWKAFFYYLGRFILFPLRRPVLTILILLVLFLAPTFRGVKPVTVPRWYATQISQTYNKFLVWWGSRQPEVSPGEFKFNPDEAAPTPVTPSEFKIPEQPKEGGEAPNILDVLRGQTQGTAETAETQVSETSSESETKKEEKVIETPEKEVIKEPTEAESQEKSETLPKVNVDVPKKYVMPKDESLYEYPAEKKVSSLKYLDYPYEITGQATVHDNNEIEVNGEFIIMYGIYMHPYTVQGGQATQYLKDLIENKVVTCGIVAYTTQNIATGICYYGGENLNRSMVIKGLTKNVAL